MKSYDKLMNVFKKADNKYNKLTVEIHDLSKKVKSMNTEYTKAYLINEDNCAVISKDRREILKQLEDKKIERSCLSDSFSMLKQDSELLKLRNDFFIESKEKITELENRKIELINGIYELYDEILDLKKEINIIEADKLLIRDQNIEINRSWGLMKADYSYLMTSFNYLKDLNSYEYEKTVHPKKTRLNKIRFNSQMKAQNEIEKNLNEYCNRLQEKNTVVMKEDAAVKKDATRGSSL